jgi:hypothetical protein
VESAEGITVPTMLLAYMIDTRMVFSVIAAASISGWTMAHSSTSK